MTQLEAHGVAVTLPTGWEGRVFRRPAAGEVGAEAADGASAPPGETTHTVLHVATIPLPPGLGDYGSAAVPDLGTRDAFVMLVEFDPADSSAPLFAGNSGVPRKLRTDDFSPKVMQRIVAGQAGTQVFCNEAGRAFCLYVVVGSYRNRDHVLPAVNQVLASLEISPLDAAATGRAPSAATVPTTAPSTTAPPATEPSTTEPSTTEPATAPTTTIAPGGPVTGPVVPPGSP
jgi:hypothetical protein